MKKNLTKKEMDAILEKTLFTEQDVALLKKIGAVPDAPNDWYYTKSDFTMKLSVHEMHGHNEYVCVTYIHYNPHREDGRTLEHAVNASVRYCDRIVHTIENGIKTVKGIIDEETVEEESK